MWRYKRSSALITSKAVLITRHFNTRSIQAFVSDLVNHLHFPAAAASGLLLGGWGAGRTWGGRQPPGPRWVWAARARFRSSGSCEEGRGGRAAPQACHAATDLPPPGFCVGRGSDCARDCGSLRAEGSGASSSSQARAAQPAGRGPWSADSLPAARSRGCHCGSSGGVSPSALEPPTLLPSSRPLATCLVAAFQTFPRWGASTGIGSRPAVPRLLPLLLCSEAFAGGTRRPLGAFPLSLAFCRRAPRTLPTPKQAPPPGAPPHPQCPCRLAGPAPFSCTALWAASVPWEAAGGPLLWPPALLSRKVPEVASFVVPPFICGSCHSAGAKCTGTECGKTLLLESVFQAAKEEKFMAGQPLPTRSERRIAGDVIDGGTECIAGLPRGTQRHPKKPIARQVRQIYGGRWQWGSGSAAQGGGAVGRAELLPGRAALWLDCFPPSRCSGRAFAWEGKAGEAGGGGRQVCRAQLPLGGGKEQRCSCCLLHLLHDALFEL